MEPRQKLEEVQQPVMEAVANTNQPAPEKQPVDWIGRLKKFIKLIEVIVSLIIIALAVWIGWTARPIFDKPSFKKAEYEFEQVGLSKWYPRIVESSSVCEDHNFSPIACVSLFQTLDLTKKSTQ